MSYFISVKVMPKKSLSELNPRTIKNYEKCLNSINMTDFTNPNSVRDRIVEVIGDTDHKGNKRSEGQIANNMRQYITAVIYKLKVDLEDTLDDEEKSDISSLIEKYRAILNMCGRVYESSRETNSKNPREIDNWIEWEEAIKLRDEFEKKFNKEKKAKKSRSKKLLIMGLYTFIPPRRLDDYCLMYYYEDKPDHLKDIIEQTDKISLQDINNQDFEVDEDGDVLPDDVKKEENEDSDDCSVSSSKALNNYYVESEKKFIFCRYKTAETYGVIEINVPDKLKEYIDDYLEFHPEIKPGRRLLDFKDTRSLRQNISDLFKEANVTRLRQSYFSWYMKTHPDATEEEKKKLGRLMAHSVKTQSQYRKIDKQDKNLVE